MLNSKYEKKVRLLVKVIPIINQESCFALHGGTAINLFIRNMLRLSVDIDLTYIHTSNREKFLKDSSDALKRIKSNIEKSIPRSQVNYKDQILKLIVFSEGAEIKIEVNLVGRGLLGEAKLHVLCEKAIQKYDVFAEINIVSLGQLYGGKICAALDRQHPRDLFDIKYLFNKEGITDEILKGFILGLCSSDRPLHEMLSPNLLDQGHAMESQFNGMAVETFAYSEFENIRDELIKTVNERLSKKDKEFLISIKDLNPDWTIYDFERFPAVQWKLLNLEKLKKQNPEKYNIQRELLRKCLEL